MHNVSSDTVSFPITVKSKESLLSLIKNQKELISQSEFSTEDLDSNSLYKTQGEWITNFANIHFPELGNFDYIHFYDCFEIIKRKMVTVAFLILGTVSLFTLIFGIHYYNVTPPNPTDYFQWSTMWWIYTLFLVQLIVGVIFWVCFKDNPSVDKMKEVCKNTKTYYKNLEQLETIVNSLKDAEVDSLLSQLK